MTWEEYKIITRVPVIIIGAGPAGCAAAITLGKLGVRHMLVEKRPFTREKVCAGGLTYKTIQTLGRLGLSEASYNPNKMSAIEVYDGVEAIYKRELKLPFYTVRRSVLDSALCKLSIGKSSVGPTDNAYVREIDYENNEVVVDGQIFGYEYLILADGCNGHGSKLAGIKEKNLCVHCKVPNKERQKTVKVFFNCIKGGYGYVFPQDTFSFVGIGNSYDKTIDYKEALKSFCSSIGVNCDLDGIVGAFTPAWKKIDFARIPRRVLVVGDAIGHASPLQAEGIPYALQDGIAAANSLAGSFDNPDNVHNEYERHHNDVVAMLKHHHALMKLVASSSKRRLSNILKLCGAHPNFLQTCLEDGMFNESFGITDMLSAVIWHMKNR